MKKKKDALKKYKKLDEEQEKIESDSNENEQHNEEEEKDFEEDEDKKEVKKRKRRKYIKKKEEEDEEKIEEEKEEEEIQIKKIVKRKKNKIKEKSKKKNEKAKIEISEDTSEDNSETSKDNANFIGKKSKIKKTKKKNQNLSFENNIMDAYKKISLYENNNNEENNEEEKNIIYTSQMKLNLKYCEKKLREALNILEKNPNLVINRNILDKLGRLTLHDKLNLNYIIGNIYMILMNKESAFDYDDEEFEINDLVLFINKVIQFKEILINTKIGIIYNNCLIKFLIKISNEFDLEDDQINIINKILDENKEIDHKNLLERNFDDLVYSISDELMKQPNMYEQYKIFIQNKSLIINTIKGADLKDKDLYDRYLEIGKDLAYLFFNKTFRLYISKANRSSNDDSENNDNDNEIDDIFGLTYLFFDGYKNNGELNVVNSEKYLVESDNKIDELRLKILDIILAYSKKFIDLIDEFAIQYIIYILIKRIYFCNLNKYNKTIINLLAEVMTNLCFFEDSPIELISYFINRILKSTKKEDENLKNKIIKKINEAKDEEGFLYKFPKSLKYLEEEKKEDITDNKNKKNSTQDKNDTKEKNKKRKSKKEKKKEEKKDEENKENEEKKEDEEKKEEEKNEEQLKEKKKIKKKYIKDKNEEEEEDNEGEEEDDDEEEEEEEEEEFDDKDDEDEKISRANNEGLLLLEKDLKIGFFYVKNIKPGEKFIFYEEITNSYGILDFCMTIQELDIKLTITDLTEGRVIFTKEGIDQLIHCPLKIVMFFSNPRILKFEFDNSYSWFTSKTVKYKTTILYPKNPYLIGHQILISKYQNIIIKGKKSKDGKDNKKIKRLKKNEDENKNKKEDENKIEDKNKNEDGELNDIENILITKIDGENKVFNCINVKENLNQINKMVKDKYLFISSIFLEIKIKTENEIEENLNKSYFYYNKEREGLVQNELTQENFEKYLTDLLSKSKANLNLINLYIINGDIKENENNNINNTKFYYFSMKKILGFEPVIKFNGMMKKIIFFIQYLNQAQILYYLYKKISNLQNYDIILLINYTKYCGYQFALYYDEEIFVDLNEFKGLSKDKSLEENIEIITKGINKLNEGDNNDNETILFEIILPKSIDDNEDNITPLKIEEKLKEKLQIDENNKIKFKIVKPLLNFNKDLQINSHVFYLDN